MSFQVRTKAVVVDAVLSDADGHDTRLLLGPSTGDRKVQIGVEHDGAILAVLVVDEQDLIDLSDLIQRVRVTSQGWIDRLEGGG